jgi:hypothetical protein
MKVDFLASIKSLNFETNSVVLSLDYLTPELVEELQNLFEKADSIKHTFKSVKADRPLSHQQRKQFWVDHHKIMVALQIPITKENSKTFYYDVVKPNIFPVRYRSLGDHQYPYIPEMKELTVEDMTDVIQRQRDFYEYLNINWGQ